MFVRERFPWNVLKKMCLQHVSNTNWEAKEHSPPLCTPWFEYVIKLLSDFKD